MLYVLPDGNYGNADGLLVIDNDNFDNHFYNYLDFMSDWLRPSFVEWFADNDHNFEEKPDSSIEECLVCEVWLSDVS